MCGGNKTVEVIGKKVVIVIGCDRIACDEIRGYSEMCGDNKFS